MCPREQYVAEIVSDHVDHTLPEGCYGSSLNCPRAVGFETEGTKVRDDTTLTADTPPCADPEIVTDSFYICNKYINVINLILFSLSGQFVREKEMKCLRYTPIGTY